SPPPTPPLFPYTTLFRSLLARTTPVGEVKRRTDGLSVFLVDLRDSLGKGLEIRPIEAMINHNTNEVFFDNLKVPAENLIGEEGRSEEHTSELQSLAYLVC